MLLAIEKSFGQLFDPKLRWVVLKSLALALVLYVLLWLLMRWAGKSIPDIQIGWFGAGFNTWLTEAMRWLVGLLAFAAPILLFPAFFGMMVGLFLDEVADAVEARHYPELGVARGTPIWSGLWSGVKFLLLMLGVNLLLLPIYLVLLFIPPTGLILFYIVNGHMTGAMYHEGVGLRRRTATETKKLRAADSGRVWMTGILIMLMGTVPLLNLLAPVVGTAMMVHVAGALRRPVMPPPFPSASAQRAA
jgi:CysZ protein